MRKSNYEVEVVVNGKPVDEYLHEGKMYIEGKEKSEFSIKIKNNGHARIVAVPTVDGLSVMDGEVASTNSRGYIIDGYGTITIDGWRTSDEKVAKFFFTSPEKSYAEVSEKGGNVGVIGVAVFEEKDKNPIVVHHYYEEIKPIKVYPVNPWPYNPWYGGGTYTLSGSGFSTSVSASYSVQSASIGDGQLTNQAVGTGFGDEKNAPVTTVSFDRKDSPSAMFEIFYNTREQLKKMGIEFKKTVYVTPSAFPADNGYCKPPKKK